MIDYRAEPEKQRRRRITTATATAAVLLTAGIYGLSISGTSLPLFASLPDSSSTPPLVPDVDLLEEIAREDSASRSEAEEEIVPGPVATEIAGLTVGERLKRLDSLMLTVPADSLEGLMAEYEQLLDSALSVRYSERGTPSYARNRKSTTPRSNSLTTTESPRPEGAPRTPAPDGAEPTTVTTEPFPVNVAITSAAEPTTPVNRQEELINVQSIPESSTPPVHQRSNDGYIRSTPSSSRRTNNSLSGTQPEGASAESNRSVSTSTTTTKSSPSITISPRSNSGASGVTPSDGSPAGRVRNIEPERRKHRQGRRERMAENQHRSRMGRMRGSGRSYSTNRGAGRTRTETESVERRYTEGLAQFRAGHFGRAIELLRPVANSSASFRNTAKYYVAVSLERTGNRQSALKIYRSLKNLGGSIGEKSSIATARLMSDLGQTSAARRVLEEFTSNRKQSRYLPQAEDLLRELAQN